MADTSGQDNTALVALLQPCRNESSIIIHEIMSRMKWGGGGGQNIVFEAVSAF